MFTALLTCAGERGTVYVRTDVEFGEVLFLRQRKEV